MGRRGADTAALAAQRAITRLCAGGLPTLDVLAAVAERVREVVPYSAAGWQLVDPATLLATGGFAQNVDPSTHLQLIEHELTGADFARFTDLGHSPTPVATLRQAPGGDLTLSSRHRRINTAVGWSHELRAVFRTGGLCRGQACLARSEGAGTHPQPGPDPCPATGASRPRVAPGRAADVPRAPPAPEREAVIEHAARTRPRGEEGRLR